MVVEGDRRREQPDFAGGDGFRLGRRVEREGGLRHRCRAAQTRRPRRRRVARIVRPVRRDCSSAWRRNRADRCTSTQSERASIAAKSASPARPLPLAKKRRSALGGVSPTSVSSAAAAASSSSTGSSTTTAGCCCIARPGRCGAARRADRRSSCARPVIAVSSCGAADARFRHGHGMPCPGFP